MENCLDLAIRTEGAVGNVAPTIDKKCGIQQRGARAPLPQLVVSIRSILADYFFAPWYSSTVLVTIVVVTFDVSVACV